MAMRRPLLNPERRTVAATSLAAFLVAAGGSVWVYCSLGSIGAGPFILGFNDAQGIMRIGGMWELAALAAFAVGMTVVNGFVAFALDERDPWMGKIVAGITLAMAVLLFIAFAAIMNVN